MPLRRTLPASERKRKALAKDSPCKGHLAKQKAKRTDSSEQSGKAKPFSIGYFLKGNCLENVSIQKEKPLRTKGKRRAFLPSLSFLPSFVFKLFPFVRISAQRAFSLLPLIV